MSPVPLYTLRDQLFAQSFNLSEQESQNLQDIFEQADKTMTPDGEIDTAEYQAIKNTPSYQHFLTKTFGDRNIEAQEAFTNQLNFLFRPTVSLPSSTPHAGSAMHARRIVHHKENHASLPSQPDSRFVLPDSLVSLSIEDLATFIDHHTSLLCDDNISRQDRFSHGQALILLLRHEQLETEAVAIETELRALAAQWKDPPADAVAYAEASLKEVETVYRSGNLSKAAALLTALGEWFLKQTPNAVVTKFLLDQESARYPSEDNTYLLYDFWGLELPPVLKKAGSFFRQVSMMTAQEELLNLIQATQVNSLAEMDADSRLKLIDGQIAALRDASRSPTARLNRGNALIAQLKNDALYLETAAVYEAMAAVAANIPDSSLEKELQLHAKFWRHFDTYGSAEASTSEIIKEESQAALKAKIAENTGSYADRMFSEAKLALLEHDMSKAKRLLTDLAKSLIQPSNCSSEPATLLAYSPEELRDIWQSPAAAHLRPEIKAFWTQAKALYDQIIQQETRERTLELLLIEAKEDQFALSNELNRQLDTERFKYSGKFWDKPAYVTQAALGLIKQGEAAYAAFEKRTTFRALMQSYLTSGEATTLQEATEIALSQTPEAREAYAQWSQWRTHRTVYGATVDIKYDPLEREAEATDRKSLDAYWNEKITIAQDRNDHDKILMYLSAILEADVEKCRAQLTSEERGRLLAEAAVAKAQERDELIEQMMNQLRDLYPDRTDLERMAMAEKAYAQQVYAYQEALFTQQAFARLKQQGVAASGPFSLELRRKALSLYDPTVEYQRLQTEFERTFSARTLITALIMAAGEWAVQVAIKGTRIVYAAMRGSEVAGDAVTGGISAATPGATVNNLLLDSIIGGPIFHTVSSLLNTPLEGSVAFDHYLKHCAVNMLIRGSLSAFKLGYTATVMRNLERRFATGTAYLEGNQVVLGLSGGMPLANEVGQIAGEAFVMSAIEMVTDPWVYGDIAHVPHISFGERYVHSVSNIIGIRLGNTMAEGTLHKIRSVLKPGRSLHDRSYLHHLAKHDIYLLNSEQFRNLAVSKRQSAMQESLAYTDPQTRHIFLNKGQLDSEDPIAHITYLIAHEETHRLFQANAFNDVLQNPKWTALRDQYLNTIYTPGGGTDSLSANQVLEEIAAHYRAWRSAGTKNHGFISKPVLALVKSAHAIFQESGCLNTAATAAILVPQAAPGSSPHSPLSSVRRSTPVAAPGIALAATWEKLPLRSIIGKYLQQSPEKSQLGALLRLFGLLKKITDASPEEAGTHYAAYKENDAASIDQLSLLSRIMYRLAECEFLELCGQRIESPELKEKILNDHLAALIAFGTLINSRDKKIKHQLESYQIYLDKVSKEINKNLQQVSKELESLRAKETKKPAEPQSKDAPVANDPESIGINNDDAPSEPPTIPLTKKFQWINSLPIREQPIYYTAFEALSSVEDTLRQIHSALPSGQEEDPTYTRISKLFDQSEADLLALKTKPNAEQAANLRNRFRILSQLANEFARDCINKTYENKWRVSLQPDKSVSGPQPEPGSLKTFNQKFGNVIRTVTGTFFPGLVNYRLSTDPHDPLYHIKLREHQFRILEAIRADYLRARKYGNQKFRDSFEGTVVSPTGSGKTRSMMAAIAILNTIIEGTREDADSAMRVDFNRGDKIIIASHRIVINDQNLRAVTQILGPYFKAKYGRDLKVSAAPDYSGDIVIASTSGAGRQGAQKMKEELRRALKPGARIPLLIFDEVHRSEAETWQNIKAAVRAIDPTAYALGFTATPTDKAGQNIIIRLKPKDLIASGALPNVELVEITSTEDLKNVTSLRSGEFVESQLADAVNKAPRNRLVMTSLSANGRLRTTNTPSKKKGLAPTLIFSAGIKHGFQLAATYQSYFGEAVTSQGLGNRKIATILNKGFTDKGEPISMTAEDIQGKDGKGGLIGQYLRGETDGIVAVVWGSMNKGARDAIMAAFARGEIETVISCDALSEGFDGPFVRNIVGARPSLSSIVIGQQAGRALRLGTGEYNDDGYLLADEPRMIIQIMDQLSDGRQLQKYREALGVYERNEDGRYRLREGQNLPPPTEHPVGGPGKPGGTPPRTPPSGSEAPPISWIPLVAEFKKELSDNYGGDIALMAKYLGMKEEHLCAFLDGNPPFQITPKFVRYMATLLYKNRHSLDGAYIHSLRASTGYEAGAAVAAVKNAFMLYCESNYPGAIPKTITLEINTGKGEPVALPLDDATVTLLMQDTPPSRRSALKVGLQKAIATALHQFLTAHDKIEAAAQLAETMDQAFGGRSKWYNNIQDPNSAAVTLNRVKQTWIEKGETYIEVNWGFGTERIELMRQAGERKPAEHPAVQKTPGGGGAAKEAPINPDMAVALYQGLLAKGDADLAAEFATTMDAHFGHRMAWYRCITGLSSMTVGDFERAIGNAAEEAKASGKTLYIDLGVIEPNGKFKKFEPMGDKPKNSNSVLVIHFEDGKWVLKEMLHVPAAVISAVKSWATSGIRESLATIATGAQLQALTAEMIFAAVVQKVTLPKKYQIFRLVAPRTALASGDLAGAVQLYSAQDKYRVKEEDAVVELQFVNDRFELRGQVKAWEPYTSQWSWLGNSVINRLRTATGRDVLASLSESDYDVLVAEFKRLNDPPKDNPVYFVERKGADASGAEKTAGFRLSSSTDDSLAVVRLGLDREGKRLVIVGSDGQDRSRTLVSAMRKIATETPIYRLNLVFQGDVRMGGEADLHQAALFLEGTGALADSAEYTLAFTKDHCELYARNTAPMGQTARIHLKWNAGRQRFEVIRISGVEDYKYLEKVAKLSIAHVPAWLQLRHFKWDLNVSKDAFSALLTEEAERLRGVPPQNGDLLYVATSLHISDQVLLSNIEVATTLEEKKTQINSPKDKSLAVLIWNGNEWEVVEESVLQGTKVFHQIRNSNLHDRFREVFPSRTTPAPDLLPAGPMPPPLSPSAGASLAERLASVSVQEEGEREIIGQLKDLRGRLENTRDTFFIDSVMTRVNHFFARTKAPVVSSESIAEVMALAPLVARFGGQVPVLRELYFKLLKNKLLLGHHDPIRVVFEASPGASPPRYRLNQNAIALMDYVFAHARSTECPWEFYVLKAMTLTFMAHPEEFESPETIRSQITKFWEMPKNDDITHNRSYWLTYVRFMANSHNWPKVIEGMGRAATSNELINPTLEDKAVLSDVYSRFAKEGDLTDPANAGNFFRSTKQVLEKLRRRNPNITDTMKEILTQLDLFFTKHPEFVERYVTLAREFKWTPNIAAVPLPTPAKSASAGARTQEQHPSSPPAVSPGDHPSAPVPASVPTALSTQEREIVGFLQEIVNRTDLVNKPEETPKNPEFWKPIVNALQAAERFMMSAPVPFSDEFMGSVLAWAKIGQQQPVNRKMFRDAVARLLNTLLSKQPDLERILFVNTPSGRQLRTTSIPLIRFILQLRAYPNIPDKLGTKNGVALLAEVTRQFMKSRAIAGRGNEERTSNEIDNLWEDYIKEIGKTKLITGEAWISYAHFLAVVAGKIHYSVDAFARAVAGGYQLTQDDAHSFSNVYERVCQHSSLISVKEMVSLLDDTDKILGQMQFSGAAPDEIRRVLVSLHTFINTWGTPEDRQKINTKYTEIKRKYGQPTPSPSTSK